MIMKKIQIGIIGGAGYTGGELIRILLNHPQADLLFVNSQSNGGRSLYEVHGDLIGDTKLSFTGGSPDYGSIDALFLCVGHGEATALLEKSKIPELVKIIDLSQDHRLLRHGLAPEFQGKAFVYGLPELQKGEISLAQHIANPGCFATAIQLGLLPLANAGLIGEIHTTGITGSTGAGQGLAATSHFSWRANNIQAYKTLTHQHLHEIIQSLSQLQTQAVGSNRVLDMRDLNFIPWRGDFTRGIFVSSQLRCELPLEKLEDLFEEYYLDHPFTILSRSSIHMKQVINTNKCVIQLEKINDTVVVHTAIDNLLKGASGQAVQNLNLMFGIAETTGLKLKGSFY